MLFLNADMKSVLEKIIWHKDYIWMDFLQSDYLCDQIKYLPEKIPWYIKYIEMLFFHSDM